MLKKKFLAAILCATVALADISLANAAQVSITDMEGPAETITDADLESEEYEENEIIVSSKATESEITEGTDGLETIGYEKAMEDDTSGGITGYGIYSAAVQSNEGISLLSDSDTSWTFNYTGGAQTFTAPATGDYQIELYGAQGNGSKGSNGSYTKGTIALTAGETLTVYVGGRNGYNGGGSAKALTDYQFRCNRCSEVYATFTVASSNGGGATDVRKGGTGLSDRIMVAAGGAGQNWYYENEGWHDIRNDSHVTGVDIKNEARASSSSSSSNGADGNGSSGSDGGAKNDGPHWGPKDDTGNAYYWVTENQNITVYGGGGGGYKGGKAGSAGTNYYGSSLVKDGSSLNGNHSGNGKAVITSLHTHSYISSVTTNATCTVAGVRTYTCSCGDTYTETIAALGHTTPSGYSYAANNGITDGLKFKNCTRCGARLETLYRQVIYVRYQNADGSLGGYNAETDAYKSADGSTIFGWSRAEDATYKAAALVWDNNSNIVPAYARTGYVTVYRKSLDYTVRHYQQNINDSGYTLKDTESFSASSGNNISPAVKTYTGFTSPARQTKVLAAEGKTTVDYYYTRNSYTVALNRGTGIASVTGNGTYKYGASVTINAVLAAGHSWSGWNGTHNVGDQSYTFTMPASNVTDTAKGTVINYTVTYELNGGTVKTANAATYNVTTDTFTLNNPTKTGYSFAGWTGSNGDHGEMLVSIAKGSTGDKSYTANWQVNQYPVAYIDVADDVSGKELGRTVKKADYDLSVRGSDLGADPADNAYHNQYSYVSDTSAAVTTDGATVYRIFQFCYTEKDSDITWDDGEDMDRLRPETYTLKLKQDGIVVSEVTLPSGQTSYTFSGIPKYDENGNAFDYEIEPIISDRYQVSKDEDGNIALEYQRSAFSVSIPKSITLDGRTGKADYVITVNGDFHYNDTLTVEPTASFIMKDRNSISTMQADVALAKTGFTKEDGVADGATAEGSVQTERTYFAGLWQGSFHFEIKFEMKN